MNNFSIQSSGNKAMITVDLSFMNIDSLNHVFDRLRLEQLVKQADFNDEVLEIGKEIKHNWWQKNREKYLKGCNISNADCY